MELAWKLVREEGTESLTLGRLGEIAGVAKPVVYDHFESRTGLLVALYEEFDARQNVLIDEAIAASGATLASRARVIAGAYVDCVIAQGREIPGIVAALSGSSELEEVKVKAEGAFREKCRQALSPFTKASISEARMAGLLGAAEALSRAAVRGEITAAEAKAELTDMITAVLKRQAPRGHAAG
jgi:AcrR family transcriptional regulator